ncbi:hypothetical protein MUP42_02285, partial [Candidatus Bathyarchaeota archaeon]|nr:hypothetical protein [Candidatus Bathyarchaeota archaeon]
MGFRKSSLVAACLVLALLAGFGSVFIKTETAKADTATSTSFTPYSAGTIYNGVDWTNYWSGGDILVGSSHQEDNQYEGGYGWLIYDTSCLPNDASVSSAVIALNTLQIKYDSITSSFNFSFWVNSSYPELYPDNGVATSYADALYDATSSITWNSSTISLGTANYTIPASWVNAKGYTKWKIQVPNDVYPPNNEYHYIEFA